jgi:ATP-binding cassette, subfamily B, bacterial
MVPQDPFVFSGTIAANIAIGRLGSTDDDIEKAARATGAHDFIRALPAGYRTQTGSGGTPLSAGQRQLISLTRAFLARPPVLILDEATSTLDIPAERAVQAAMRAVMRGGTTLIIAHRLSTVQIADRVIVITSGQIAQDGTPAGLLTRNGPYARLHHAWLDTGSRATAMARPPARHQGAFRPPADPRPA